MRMKRIHTAIGLSCGKILGALFVVVSIVTGINAQSPSEAEAVSARLSRARALAAAHNLAAAANELDALRKTTTDDSVRDVARLMLMGVCLEEGNYMRAQILLDEIYAERSAQHASSTESYFALAGQALNGAREHLERYRSFGINVASKDLPAEAVSDLDRLRSLLDKIADQARQLTAEESRATAAAALLEDVSSLRASLARNTQERQQWQREMASARQKLSAEEARITPVSGTVNKSQSIPANNTVTTRAETTKAAAPPVAGSAPMTTVAEKRDVPDAPTAVASSAASSESTKLQDGKPVNVGSLIEKATQKINPLYPQAAKGARITGVVTVYVEVDQNGVVSTAQSTNGPLLLRQAALDAARRWKFRPTLVEGQPVRVAGFISFNFTL